MYYLTNGTLQPMIVTDPESSHFMQHFGLAEYDVSKPVIKAYHRKAVRPIVDGLNNGSLTEDAARKLLAEI